MPTFNEDVTVNGAVTVNRRGDGAVLLNLSSERSWEFRQLRSGQDTALELVNIGGGGNKSLIISTTGQVGIGTQSPQATLDLNASRNPQLPASFPGMRITRQGNGAVLLHLATERPWEFRQRGSGAGTALELASVGVGGSNKSLIINTTGRVGIGTTTPEHTLDVNGSIRAADDVIVTGADCAEEFDIDPASSLEPGTVMVIGPHGRLEHCSRPYDRRVAGIVSGTGDRRPGIVLGRVRSAADNVRIPLALTGTVFCNVDATTPIDVGDLLTTSSRPGHAMQATDANRSFGSVVGKALDGLTSGTGMIRVLATLQ
jgi:hypothetical protein